MLTNETNYTLRHSGTDPGGSNFKVFGGLPSSILPGGQASIIVEDRRSKDIDAKFYYEILNPTNNVTHILFHVHLKGSTLGIGPRLKRLRCTFCQIEDEGRVFEQTEGSPVLVIGQQACELHEMDRHPNDSHTTRRFPPFKGVHVKLHMVFRYYNYNAAYQGRYGGRNQGRLMGGPTEPADHDLNTTFDYDT